MSSNRLHRRLVLASLVGLAGCGFAPINRKGSDGLFQFETEDSEIGFRVQDRLVDRLGAPNNPRYAIKTSTDLSQRQAAITEDGDTSRFNVIGRTNWSLIDIGSGGQIETGRVEAFTSYSATGTTVATQTTQDDARARLAIILADMIVTRILLIAPT